MKQTVTRFAPSPTGSLHIGGARTALFNWLYARNTGGKFLIRIEDTDQKRSTTEATDEIFRALKWLGISWDGKPVSQKENFERHQEVANYLLENGLAYKCYSTQKEILNFQEEAKQKGNSSLFRSPWRDRSEPLAKDQKFVIRLRAPESGTTDVIDKIKGKISWKNNTLDDLVLLRQDGSPTYMLAVVVDDHDMSISHVIRGDDHLTNTARQILIYDAMNWKIPEFAHLPLIHGSDGQKMSKRHGAISVGEYWKTGYPAEAFNNYLARLGWSYGDEELFSISQAIKWFSIEGIGKSPSRFDIKKLNNISKNYIASLPPNKLVKELLTFLSHQKSLSLTKFQIKLLKISIELVRRGSRNYDELIENAQFILKTRPVPVEASLLEYFDTSTVKLLDRLTLQLRNVRWSAEEIEEALKVFIETESINYREIALPLRIALLGKTSSPSITEVMSLLGKDETLDRLTDMLFDKIE